MGKEAKFCTRCGKRLVVQIIEADNHFDAVIGKAKRLRITQCPDYAPRYGLLLPLVRAGLA